MPVNSDRTGNGRRGQRVFGLHFAALAMGLSTPALAIDWVNPSGGNWADPTNWANQTVPGSTETAVFALNGQYDVQIGSTTLVSGIEVGKGAPGLNVAPQQTFQAFGLAIDQADTRLFGGGEFVIGDPDALFPAGAFTLNRGSLAITDPGTVATAANDFELGTVAGYATFTLAQSAVAELGRIRAGVHPDSNVWLTVRDNDNQTLLRGKAAVIGMGGSATLSVVNEGRYNADAVDGLPAITIGYGDASVGRGRGFVLVDGNKSLIRIKGQFNVGDGGDGTLVISNAGRAGFSGVTKMEVASVIGGNGGNGHVLVTGAASSLRLNGAMIVNQNVDSATVRIEDGGLIRAERVLVDNSATSAPAAAPAILVSGANSTLSTPGKIDMKSGLLRIENNGHVEAGIGLRLGADGTRPSRAEFNGGTLRLGELTMAGGDLVLATGGDKLVRTGRVFFYSEQGGIDLADNAMMIDYFEFESSPLDGVRAAIAPQSGGANTPRIRSSIAAADPTHFALGIAEGADLPSTGGGMRTFFREAADNTSVLVRYTYRGDGNLDGTVDIGDFARLAAHFNQSGRWFQGDFNYDGAVNVADFAAMASNFGQTLPGGGTTSRPGAVPEPAAIGVLAVAAGAMLRRRRGA